MSSAVPRPPLLGRLPAQLWLVLDVGAVILFGTLIYVTTPPYLTPTFLPTHEFVELTVVARAGLARPGGRAGARGPARAGSGTGADTAALDRGQPVSATYLAAPVRRLHAGRHHRGHPRPSHQRARGRCHARGVAWPMAVEPPGNGVDYGKAPTVVLAVAVAWVIGNSIRQRRDYTETVREQAAASAVMAERLRIARECTTHRHSIGVIAFRPGWATG